MKTQKISYKDTNQFNQLIIDYVNHDKALSSHVSEFPNIDNFSHQIRKKSADNIDRDLLVNVIKNQNKGVALSKESDINIELLKEDNTFTVTTGHQLCLFAGPLYFIYKIASAINLVNSLKKKYPQYNFLPLFWLASEDHDFEEINSITLFNKEISWKTNQKGPVGRMSLEGLDLLLEKISNLIGHQGNSKELLAVFRKSYKKEHNLSMATRVLVNELFGSYGLLVIDGDDSLLKQKLTNIIDEDINYNKFYDIIKSSSDKLSVKYHAQAYVRPINFFKISDGERIRVKEKVGKEFIQENPDLFSPNVLLRPIYQELILPNIAYIGGGSEISYWLQLHDVFDEIAISMPMLLLRNSVINIDTKQSKRVKSLGLDILDFFQDIDQINKRYILNSSSHSSFDNELIDLGKIFASFSEKIEDPSLIASLDAINKKTTNSLNLLEKKLIRNLKLKHENKIIQIKKIKEALFPDNKLQERHDSFIPLYLRYGDNFIKKLISILDPLDPNFVILNLEN